MAEEQTENVDVISEPELLPPEEQDFRDMVPGERQIQIMAQPSAQVARAVQEVRAKLMIAREYPRDEVRAYKRIIESCKRPTLAAQGIYRLPINGDQKVGPSIRLAETCAKAWENISYGIKEVHREPGKSNCIAYCWDQETNTSAETEFIVEHFLKKKNGDTKRFEDPVEVGRLIRNHGQRHVRNCILQIIPGDIIEDAMKQCRATVANGGGVPIGDRIRMMVVAFAELSISQQMIEDRLGHPIDETNGEEIADLQAIYKSLQDKQAKRSDFFKTGEVDIDEKNAEVAAKIKAMGQTDTQATAPKE